MMWELLFRLQYWLVAKLTGEPKAMSKLNWHLSIEKDLYRIIGLVQENQDLFGNPPAGESCIKLAADKLEQDIVGGYSVSSKT